MAHDPLFDSAENQALLVVCARKTIRTAAIIGIVWGSINLAIGFFLVQVNPLNAGILILGLLMLGTGITALRKPSLHALLGESVASLLLFVWNAGIAIFNSSTGHGGHMNVHGLIWPVIAAAIFFKQYKKLGHLKDAIATMDHATLKEASTICKQVFKSKLKRSPDIVEASSKRCRLKLMSESVLCVQRNLARAFSLNRTDFQQCLRNGDKKRVKVVIQHPLGKLTYAFNKKNSDRIKGWLAGSALPTA